MSTGCLPDYAALHKWELYSANLSAEHQQLMDEGRTVERYELLVGEIMALPMGKAREDMAAALAGLMQAEPVRGGHPGGLDARVPEKTADLHFRRRHGRG